MNGKAEEYHLRQKAKEAGQKAIDAGQKAMTSAGEAAQKGLEMTDE